MIKPNPFGGALLFHLVNDFIRVGKFHPRIAEYNDKRRFRQGVLDQIQQDDGIFAAAERHVKTIQPLLITPPIIVNAFNCCLPQIFHKLKIFFGHLRQVDGQKRFTLGKAVSLNKFKLRLFIKGTALDDSNFLSAIKIIARLHPKVRNIILNIVMPTSVEAQNIHLCGIDGTRLLGHALFSVGEQKSAGLVVKFVSVHF